MCAKMEHLSCVHIKHKCIQNVWVTQKEASAFAAFPHPLITGKEK